LIELVRKEATKRIVKDVINCFLWEHGSDVRNIFNVYIADIKKFRKKEASKKEEGRMRRIEEKIGITESQKMEWRLSLLLRVVEEGAELKNFPRVKRAVEEIVLEDLGPIIQMILLSEDIKDKEQKKKGREVIIERLKKMGYSRQEAEKAMEITADKLRETS